MTAQEIEMDFGVLHPWIQDSHLDADKISGYREAFSSSRARLLSIKSFLREDVASQLAQCLEREIEFKPTFSLYPSKRVTEEEWMKEDESKRFFRFSQLAGIKPEFQMSRNVLTYLRFRKAFLDPEFIRFFEEVSGLSLSPTDDFSLHRMDRGDFLHIHNDVHETRRLAFVMYLTPGWEPSFGGSLHMKDAGGQVTTVSPDYNSIVIFDVKAKTQHSVEEIAEGAGESARLSMGGWFHERS
jgi:Rps23 Pro-64 3,4-dihydroxylase Tpa1-like proline 4-hydroxylase